MDRYQYLGLSLIGFAAPISVYSYLILNDTTLTAFGLSTIILGVTLLQVPSNPMPSQSIRAMLAASYLNIEALLEEYDANGKAIYFNQSERINAFIPTHENAIISSFNTEEVRNRVITKINQIDGLLIYPPGSELVRLASLPDEISLEDALNSVLVDLSESVDSVKSIQEFEKVLVELGNPKEETKLDRVEKTLGIPSVNISGCIIAKILGTSIQYQRSEQEETKTTALFKILRE